MPSYRDLLKFAHTGIAAPDMSYRDMLRARSIGGGGFPVSTITGVPPISFTGDGTPLISWTLWGNMTQSGTPTPASPIQPQACGDRTANVLEYSLDALITNIGTVEKSGSYQTYFAPVTAGQTYSFGANIDVYGFFDTKPALGTVAMDGARHFPDSSRNVTIPDSVTWLGCRVRMGADAMLNTGTTALPYEPFGYKIPITNAGQTVPVYLGQTQTVRRVRKLVLSSSQNWQLQSINSHGIANLYITLTNDFLNNTSIISNYFARQTTTIADTTTEGFLIALTTNTATVYIRINSQTASTAQEFKSWLDVLSEEASIWYVLETPTTGIINEPLAKIDNYADELHSADAAVTIPTAKGDNTLTVDTDLPPSSVSITGHIK